MNDSFFPCRTSSISKVGRFAALFIYPCVGSGIAMLLFPLVHEIVTEKHTVLQLIFLFLSMICMVFLSFLFLYVSRRAYIMESRYVTFNQCGFLVRNGKKSIGKQYEWRKVFGIGIIAYAANASKQNYQTQICIFLEAFDDKQLKKLRDSYLFGVLNLDSFVLLDYDPLMREKLERCAGPSIHDLRIKQLSI